MKYSPNITQLETEIDEKFKHLNEILSIAINVFDIKVEEPLDYLNHEVHECRIFDLTVSFYKEDEKDANKIISAVYPYFKEIQASINQRIQETSMPKSEIMFKFNMLLYKAAESDHLSFRYLATIGHPDRVNFIYNSRLDEKN